MGYLLLEGGAEFGGMMRDPDRKAIELAGGVEAPIRMGKSTMPPSPKVKASGGEPMKRSVGSARSTLPA